MPKKKIVGSRKGNAIRSLSTTSLKQMGKDVNSLAADLAKATHDIKVLAAYGREQYAKLDKETKRRALAAAGALAGLLAAGATIRAVRARRAKKAK